jgi:hypothetical protein
MDDCLSAKEKCRAMPQATGRKALSPDETNYSGKLTLSDENTHYNVGKTRFEVTPVYKERGARTVTGILIKMLREDEPKRMQRP